MRHEGERCRKDPRDPDPLEDPGNDQRSGRPTRLDTGEHEDAAADEVGRPADREHAQATDPIDDDTGEERGRDLDERGHTDDQPDLRVGHTGPSQGDRQRRREPMEPGLDGEEREGESEHGAIIEAQRAAPPDVARNAASGGTRPRTIATCSAWPSSVSGRWARPWPPIWPVPAFRSRPGIGPPVGRRSLPSSG